MSTARKLADLLTSTGDVKLDALDNVSSDFSGLTDTTVSDNDPTITINPSAIGHLWVNKTSGEQYICTDITTDNNIWTNTGDGFGSVSPNDPPVITGLSVDPSIPSSLSSETTTLLTWSGATDPDGDNALIVYSATSISDSSLTISAPSGGSQGQLNLVVGTVTSDITGVTFKILVTDEYGMTAESGVYTIDLLANQAPVITGLTVDTTAIASYTWSDLSAGTTNYTIAGATDPDGDNTAIVYTIENIQGDSGKITASGGVAGTDNVSLVVATLTADITGVTFDVVATDEDNGTATSTGHTLDLVAYSAYSISYLMVAGGGKGGNVIGGGGGAGGLLESTFTTLSSSSQFTMTVGASENDSEITSTGFTALNANAGGYGGKWSGDIENAGSGGSGGGAVRTPAGVGAVGSATPAGQGNAGGSPGIGWTGGGGGGYGDVGGNASGSSPGGIGGIGLQSSITGTSTYYAGGGGGGVNGVGGVGGSGGNGGGGDGVTWVTNSIGNNGDANTGGGGGGSGSPAGSGGSGIIILKILNANYSGTTTGSPAIDTTTVSGYTILKYTGTGTYTT